jgi:hypothetical protein
MAYSPAIIEEVHYLMELSRPYFCSFCCWGNKNLLSWNKHNTDRYGFFILFTIQQFGTKLVNFFAPMMLIWFGMLAILGIAQITQNTALKAINLIMLSFISIHPEGFFCSRICFLMYNWCWIVLWYGALWT